MMTQDKDEWEAVAPGGEVRFTGDFDACHAFWRAHMADRLIIRQAGSAPLSKPVYRVEPLPSVFRFVGLI